MALVKEDAQYSVSTIALCAGIPKRSAYTNMTKHLKVRKIAARWIPHLLTPKQRRLRVKCDKELLKNVLNTTVKSWFHF